MVSQTNLPQVQLVAANSTTEALKSARRKSTLVRELFLQIPQPKFIEFPYCMFGY